MRTLSRELQAAGVKTTKMTSKPVDVKATRLRLGMSQEQFALRFALDLDAIENWEQGRREPDPAALAYLRVIARLPREAANAQEEEPA
jgi:putative transcriptional regulator